MKKIFILAVSMAMVLAVSIQAQAALETRGKSFTGKRLIYDTDLNITWYDFTTGGSTWQRTGQMHFL